MVLTAYTALSPGTGLSCPRHRRDAKHRRQLDTSVGVSGPHGFAVRSSPFQKPLDGLGTSPAEALAKADKRALVRRAPRVHRIPFPTSVTIAKRPSEWERDGVSPTPDFRFGKTEIFLRRGLDKGKERSNKRAVICPSGGRRFLYCNGANSKSVPRMLRNAPPLAAWCAADPGSILWARCRSRLSGAPLKRRCAASGTQGETPSSRHSGRAKREPIANSKNVPRMLRNTRLSRVALLIRGPSCRARWWSRLSGAPPKRRCAASGTRPHLMLRQPEPAVITLPP